MTKFYTPQSNNHQENQHQDMTRPPDLIHKSGTGPIRSHRPEYRSFLPPCNHACPAGENIQAWLSLAQAGEFEQAWQTLIADNPMPAVHGRACYHPCETTCNRTQVDESVSIHAIERFLGDQALVEGWQPDLPTISSGKKILIVGAGPSGLSCAWHLRRLGHRVEIREAGPKAGGMMHFGIPAYRLPRDVLDQEINRILDSGISLKLNYKVENVLDEKNQGEFDAVFLAIGAHLATRVDIPARDSSKILDAVSYLESVENGNAPKLGRRVAIYGGGNSAMDVARTAQRLGAEEAMIIYRRDLDNMPANEIETREALEEGIKVNWLRSISSVSGKNITVEVMSIDEHGKVIPTGQFETLEADSLILALGQKVDSSIIERIEGLKMNNDGVVVVNQNMMTTVEGIFAGGDMVPSERTITVATGHGKKAARCIDAWLSGQDYHKTQSGELEPCPELHLWYNTESHSNSQPILSTEARRTGFDEVVGSLTQAQAIYEAGRCYSCGNCFECDGCFGACPEGAVIKLGKDKGYEIDYDQCTGCEACFKQCPCHAMIMVKEEQA
tara:strand:- start:4960 stop:6630 length:1671 start_codon:yes stop_codon:yes gene_type:complete